MRRRLLLACAFLLMPGALAAQDPPRRPARPRRRRLRAAAPLPVPPPAPPSRSDPAPVPNRDMEAPRGAGSGAAAPRIDPTLIDPNAPRIGATSDPNSPVGREDRLLRQPAPGARLRVPFGS
jgi:hypothetical protein